MPVRKIAIAEPPAPQVSTVPSTSLMPMFTQPSSTSSTFNNRLGRQKICLESALADGQESVRGTARVVNLSFHKTIIVKWTTNDWASSAETTATYVKGSSKDETDQFRFKLELGSLPVGSRLQFCLKYICEGEHWDSNGGANYVFQVAFFFLSSNFDMEMRKYIQKYSFKFAIFAGPVFGFRRCSPSFHN